MLKKLIHNRLAAFGRSLNYDTSYLGAVLDADLSAFMRLAKLQGISDYRRDVPVDVQFAVKLTGAMHEDCGPCSQLMITMAERAGVSAETLRAVAASDDAALSPEVRLAVEFARATLDHDLRADALREQIVARWGQRGLVSLSFGLVAARVYPTLKYALGYGRTCSRLQVDGKPISVKPERSSAGAFA